MSVIIFCLTITAMYAIMVIAYKAWKRADEQEKNEEILDKMHDIEEVGEQYENVKQFKKTHKGDVKKQRKEIKKFTKE